MCYFEYMLLQIFCYFDDGKNRIVLSIDFLQHLTKEDNSIVYRSRLFEQS